MKCKVVSSHSVLYIPHFLLASLLPNILLYLRSWFCFNCLMFFSKYFLLLSMQCVVLSRHLRPTDPQSGVRSREPGTSRQSTSHSPLPPDSQHHTPRPSPVTTEFLLKANISYKNLQNAVCRGAGHHLVLELGINITDQLLHHQNTKSRVFSHLKSKSTLDSAFNRRTMTMMMFQSVPLIQK